MTTDRRFATRTLTALIGPAFAVAALALLSMPAAASAQAGRGAVDEGNRLYEEGRYQEALERYLDALRENPESPLIRFNAGNALYQSQDFQRALEAYREAIESGDPALASTAWYNLGDALYQSGDLQGSAEAFKQALRIDPGDVDAKHNLERVLQQQMQQQEQQQNPDGDSGENDEQENESDPNEQEQNDDPEAGEGEPGEESEGDENESENEGENEGDDDESEGEEQDPEEQESDADSDRAPGEGEPEGEQGGRPMPQEGAMSREEAERLLAALDEDPGDVNRRSAAARGRIPRKKW